MKMKKKLIKKMIIKKKNKIKKRKVANNKGKSIKEKAKNRKDKLKNYNYIRKIMKLIIILFSIFFSFKVNKEKIINKWEKYSLNPIIGNIFTGTVFDPFVLRDKDGLYKMYLSWRKTNTIAMISSKDGINWSDLKIVLNKGNDWESVVNRACFLIKDGIYHMWYTGQNNGISKIGYANSEDGINFKRLNNPVLIPEYKFEKYSVMNPDVIYDKKEKIFKMWYAAGETVEPDVICYATSKDGINWKKYENNPILTKRENKIFLDYYKIGACDIHKLSYNRYLMFYIGYSDLHTARIFIAISKNGINNWKRSSFPIIEPTKGTFDSNACYKPSALYNNKKRKWLLYYNGRNSDKEFIGLVTYKGSKFFAWDPSSIFF